MSKKSKVKKMPCPEGCGNVLTVDVGVCVPAWEVAVCGACDAVNVDIATHRCHWIPYDRKCKKNEIAWLCCLGSHSIICPANFDPNRKSQFFYLPQEIKKTDEMIMPPRCMVQYLKQKSADWKKNKKSHEK